MTLAKNPPKSPRLRYKLQTQWNRLFEISEALRSLKTQHAMELTTPERELVEELEDKLAGARTLLNRLTQD